MKIYDSFLCRPSPFFLFIFTPLPCEKDADEAA
jgi:hypothetical protein